MASVATVARRAVGKIRPEKSALLVCDMQERFRSVISGFPSILEVTSTMVSASSLLKVPVVVTEQYPKAFGHTVPELGKVLPDNTKIFEKKLFSMVTPETAEELKTLGVESAILVGIETHVCVLQTTLDLLEMGIDVHIISDGVSSQRLGERQMALERLRQSGAFITSCESMLFQLMQSAGHEHFRAISGMVKEQAQKSDKDSLLGTSAL